MKRILIFLLFIPTFAYCNWNDGFGDYTAEKVGGAVGGVIDHQFSGALGTGAGAIIGGLAGPEGVVAGGLTGRWAGGKFGGPIGMLAGGYVGRIVSNVYHDHQKNQEAKK